MSLNVTHAAYKAGLSPGTLVYVGEAQESPIKINLIDYDQEKYTDKKLKKIEEAFPFRTAPTITWINIVGLSDVDVIQKISDHFDIHPLVQEDILNTHQRPKIEDFETYIYIVIKGIQYNETDKKIEDEQISIILGNNFVISFQEKENSIFTLLRERLKDKNRRIRKSKADYLTYGILDGIVDHYFVFIEKLENEIEKLEDDLLSNPTQKDMHKIQYYKRKLLYVRKLVGPARELLNSLIRTNSKLVQESTIFFLRDVYDHIIRVLESLDFLRETLNSLLEIYLSTISNKMNEIMKVLTLFASIFIPLTFVAGIYGMNFEYMPELKWKYGYGIFWIITIINISFLLFFFKKKKWL